MVFSRIYFFIRVFSIDIVAGVLASLVFASSVMNVSLPRSHYTVLGLVVWLIYIADHLMDGAKTRGKSTSETHNFFNSYKIPIILIFLLVVIFTFRLILYRLELNIIEFGIAPGFAVMIYLLLNRYYEKESKWFFIKELWIAVIYTLAVWGGPVIYAGDIISPVQFIQIAAFGLVILGNVLIYSIYEREADEIDGNRSIVINFGLKYAMNMAVYSLTLSILIALTAYIFLGAKLNHVLPLILISASMLIILMFPRIFAYRKLYGVISDFLLLLFLLVLLW